MKERIGFLLAFLLSIAATSLAAQFQMGVSSSRIFAVLEELNRSPAYLFHSIESMTMKDETHIEVVLKDEKSVAKTHHFLVTEKKCKVSECGYTAKEISGQE